MRTCPACDQQSNGPVHVAREMMFGTGGEYLYAECRACGTLELLNIPDDLGTHYPPSYYSFERSLSVGRWGRLMRRVAFATLLGPSGPWRSGVTRLSLIPRWASLLPGTRLRRTDPVLELGTGSGERLLSLQAGGFTDLLGVDPYTSDADPAPGVRVRRMSVDEVEGQFGLILLTHTLEHVPSPRDTLSAVARRLAPGGVVIVRMPVAASAAWRQYGPDWVQLDAPRHLVVFSVAGFRALAARAGLAISRTVFDSTAFQFWGSEQYQRGIPLRSPESHLETPTFPRDVVDAWTRRAKQLNVASDGDSACYLLVPA